MSSSDESPDAPEPSDSSTSSEEVDQVCGRGHGRSHGRGMGRPAQGCLPLGWSMAVPTPQIPTTSPSIRQNKTSSMHELLLGS